MRQRSSKVSLYSIMTFTRRQGVMRRGLALVSSNSTRTSRGTQHSRTSRVGRARGTLSHCVHAGECCSESQAGGACPDLSERWAVLAHRTTQACRRQRTTHRCRRPHITLVCRQRSTWPALTVSALAVHTFIEGTSLGAQVHLSSFVA